MRLQGALDNEVRIIAEKLVERDGVPVDVAALYSALQRSNSSLKRRPRKTLESALERVVEYLRSQGSQQDDSEAEIEAKIIPDTTTDAMNRSLRANLAAPLPAEAEEPQRRADNGESLPKRVKRSTDKKMTTAAPEGISIEDIGGMDHVLEQLEDLVVVPMQSPDIYSDLHIPPPQGVLLHGPPGCGKTMISRALAAELGKPFIEILGPSVVSSMSGDSEKAIRERFDEAKKQAPCLIFIDEIDAIAPKRESSQSQMEKRLVAQLLVSMDDLHKDSTKPVIVLAATNRPDSIDPALRRGGRFGSEINIGVPNEQVRRKILEVQTRQTPLAPDVDFAQLAKLTAGFVGSDLHDLVTKAATHLIRKYRDAMKQQAVDLGLGASSNSNLGPGGLSIKRYIARTNIKGLPRPPGFEALGVSMKDFLSVLPSIIPSSKREGFATIPDVSWDDIGALEKVREGLREAIVWPIQEPELFAAVGITASTNVLLWGPPGCGKTLLASAAAAESKANFIKVKGPELLNKFVGESEAAVRKVFARARSSIPCVIFFDEFDALVPSRTSMSSEVNSRVVNTMLTELDEVANTSGIFVVAATNRPDAIDEAMLRPGRLGTKLFVDVPGPEERVAIFRALVRKRKAFAITSEIEELLRSELCDGYSGADLGAVVHETLIHALRNRRGTVELSDLQNAVKGITGSVQDASKYREMAERFNQ